MLIQVSAYGVSKMFDVSLWFLAPGGQTQDFTAMWQIVLTYAGFKCLKMTVVPFFYILLLSHS